MVGRTLSLQRGDFLKDGVDKNGHTNNLAHPALSALIIEFFYTGTNAMANVFPEVFQNEVPRPAVALAAMAIKVALDEIVAEGKRSPSSVMFMRMFMLMYLASWLNVIRLQFTVPRQKHVMSNGRMLEGNVYWDNLVLYWDSLVLYWDSLRQFWDILDNASQLGTLLGVAGDLGQSSSMVWSVQAGQMEGCKWPVGLGDEANLLNGNWGQCPFNGRYQRRRTAFLHMAGICGDIAGSLSATITMATTSLALLPNLQIAVTTWLVGVALADMITAASLVWHLGRHKHLYPSLSSSLNRILRMTIQTAVLMTSVAILDLACYLTVSLAMVRVVPTGAGVPTPSGFTRPTPSLVCVGRCLRSLSDYLRIGWGADWFVWGGV
ncbi:hypothetical protein EDD15DRAFT_2521479 [Pisolithus albus]|nr:hypothetical protein EDD15DRAFT_2521479 [Pisolithus albus]